jgi:hypothetical protein
MEHIEITKIIVHAKSGTEVGTCIKDCITLASKEWRNVQLIFGDETYDIYVNDLLDAAFSHHSKRETLK